MNAGRLVMVPWISFQKEHVAKITHDSEHRISRKKDRSYSLFSLCLELRINKFGLAVYYRHMFAHETE
jgi:hypothetical protein